MKRSLLPLALLPLLAAAACSTEEPTSIVDDVTDIPQSDVKNQSIGNCWVYATIGWAESLHLRYTSEELNLSESYITYWHWMEQIAGGPGGLRPVATNDGTKLKTGGFWGVAGELSLRYGLIAEGDFIPEEAEASRSSRQSSAESAINASLKDGVLSDPANRADPAIVRAELNAAWGLDEEVIAALDAAFGEDGQTTLYDTTLPEGSIIFSADTVDVGFVDGRTVTLADAFGEPANSWEFYTRRGEFAWSTEYYPSSPAARRSFQIDMQSAMHANQPILISWLVDFNAMDGAHFTGPPETPGRQGGHLVVAYDYQIHDVPGYGTLAAGETVLDEAALEAALAPEANIEFIRIKNSWGTRLAPENAEDLGGYHDLYMEYLDGPIAKCGDTCETTTPATPMRRAILPSPRFVEATNDTCDTSKYQDNCRGDVLTWCDEGRIDRFDCTDADWVCGYSEDLGAPDCIDAPTSP